MNELLEYFESVQYRIEEEGMDYCFDGYSDWSEIKDKEFHKLRNLYLESAEKLRNYIDTKVDELNDSKN